MSIARAFVNRPLILLADEPTGNLDPATSVGIMRLLDRINRTGTTVVMATHDRGIVDTMRRRVIELDRGHDRPRPGPRRVRVANLLAMALQARLRRPGDGDQPPAQPHAHARVGHHRRGVAGARRRVVRSCSAGRRQHSTAPLAGRRRVHRVHAARRHARSRSTRCSTSLDGQPRGQSGRRYFDKTAGLRRVQGRSSATSPSSSTAVTAADICRPSFRVVPADQTPRLVQSHGRPVQDKRRACMQCRFAETRSTGAEVRALSSRYRHLRHRALPAGRASLCSSSTRSASRCSPAAARSRS